MLTILITILHVLVSLFLILVVLAQQGKGQDLAGAFGGMGSQTAFGARGTATLLSKITAGAAILFMVTSLSLSYLRPAVGTSTVVPETPVTTAPTDTGTPTEEPAPAEESPAAPAGESEEPAEGEGAGDASDGAASGESEGEGESEPPPQG